MTLGKNLVNGLHLPVQKVAATNVFSVTMFNRYWVLCQELMCLMFSLELCLMFSGRPSPLSWPLPFGLCSGDSGRPGRAKRVAFVP